MLGTTYLPLRLYYVGKRTDSVVVESEVKRPPNLPAHAFSPPTPEVVVLGFEGRHWVAQKFAPGEKCVVLSLPSSRMVMVLKSRPKSPWQVFWAWNIRFSIWSLLGAVLQCVVLGMLIRGLYSILKETSLSLDEVLGTPSSSSNYWNWAGAVVRSEFATRFAFVVFLNVAVLALLWVMLKTVILVEAHPFAETTTGAVFLVAAFLMVSKLSRLACRGFLRLDASITMTRIRSVVTNFAGAVAFVLLGWRLVHFALYTNFRDFNNLGEILVELVKEFIGA